MSTVQADLYLVPYDFTSVTEEAMHFALQLAHKGGGSILLAHIVKNEDDIIEFEQKLKLNLGPFPWT